MTHSKLATSPTHVPEGPHWAILVFGSITIPGDERSRTHPGHGYPESTETTVSYYVFTDEASWRAEIEARASRVFPGSDFVALVVNRPKVRTRTVVEVS
jgi:hypothetical protein